MEIVFVDQCDTGGLRRPERPTTESSWMCEAHGGEEGAVPLPRRRVLEQAFGLPGRFRRLARDYERSGETLAGWHRPAFLTMTLGQCRFERQYQAFVSDRIVRG